MNYNNPESPLLYNLESIRKAGQEAKYKVLGLISGENLFESLDKIKVQDPVVSKYLRNIGFNKFYITYWSAQQVQIHNDLSRKTRNPISLDATGSVALKINHSVKRSSHIFLSVLCTHVNSTIVPLTQVLSETNDSNFSCYWLRDWLKSGAKIPREVVTDMGQVPQIGISMAFNNITFDTYNEQCLLILQGKKSILSNTQLRTDIAHLIHAVSRWSCLSNHSSHKVKEIFKRCVGFMTTIEKLDHFVLFLKKVFILSCSKVYDDQCQDAFKIIKSSI